MNINIDLLRPIIELVFGSSAARPGCEPGDIVTDGKRVGMVYGAAAPSPFYGETDWQVYVGNLPGEPAWSDYWSVSEVEPIT